MMQSNPRKQFGKVYLNMPILEVICNMYICKIMTRLFFFGGGGGLQVI